MRKYKPSDAEIEAALSSWFPDARTGWGNPTFTNRAFWRQMMREALTAADMVRVTVLPARAIRANISRRIAPRGRPSPLDATEPLRLLT